MARKKSKYKIYSKKSTARNVAKKRKGSQRIRKVKGGYVVTPAKKRRR